MALSHRTVSQIRVIDIMDSIVEETVSQPMPEANISSQEQIQMQEMEDEYLNLEPPVSPSQPEVPASLPVTIARSPAPSPPTQNTQDIEVRIIIYSS